MGKTNNEHLAALEEVLQRLEQVGLHLQLKKCSFMVFSVIYLGYQVDTEGLCPLAEKVGCTRTTKYVNVPHALAPLLPLSQT